MQKYNHVKEFAAKHKVSYRTAERYINAGRIPEPPEMRKQGIDGRYYPVKNFGTAPIKERSKNYMPLMIMRSNIKRISKAKSIDDNDLNLLRDIVFQSTRLFENWEYKRQAGKI